MDLSSFDDVKAGFILCLLGSDKPIIESFTTKPDWSKLGSWKQFKGMSDVDFYYSDYEEARKNLIALVNDALTDTDKEFLLSFEDRYTWLE